MIQDKVDPKLKARIDLLQVRADQLELHINNMLEQFGMENESGKAMLEWMYESLDEIYKEKAELTRQI